MVERRPWLSVLTHLVLIAGVVMIAFPLYITFVASTRVRTRSHGRARQAPGSCPTSN